MSLGTTTAAARCTDLAGDPGARSSAHTPGPWVVDTSEWRYRGTIRTSDGYYVARANRLSDNQNRDANARLIAAAPELVAALELIRRRAVAHPGDDIAECKRQMFHIESLARTAIAKATGAAQ